MLPPHTSAMGLYPYIYGHSQRFFKLGATDAQFRLAVDVKTYACITMRRHAESQHN
jgi:hypothetical protein